MSRSVTAVQGGQGRRDSFEELAFHGRTGELVTFWSLRRRDFLALAFTLRLDELGGYTGLDELGKQGSREKRHDGFGKRETWDSGDIQIGWPRYRKRYGRWGTELSVFAIIALRLYHGTKR